MKKSKTKGMDDKKSYTNIFTEILNLSKREGLNSPLNLETLKQGILMSNSEFSIRMLVENGLLDRRDLHEYQRISGLLLLLINIEDIKQGMETTRTELTHHFFPTGKGMIKAQLINIISSLEPDFIPNVLKSYLVFINELPSIVPEGKGYPLDNIDDDLAVIERMINIPIEGWTAVISPAIKEPEKLNRGVKTAINQKAHYENLVAPRISIYLGHILTLLHDFEKNNSLINKRVGGGRSKAEVRNMDTSDLFSSGWIKRSAPY
jgi:hypothetical protein